MKTVCKFATLTLMMLAVTVFGFSQKSISPRPLTTTQNLVRGAIGPLSNSANWPNYSVLNLIPGSALFPVTSSTTVFYFGFTAGTEADIGNIVLYTTPRGRLTISAATPVTLGSVSNPSIILSNTSVCPVQPPSAANPCVVRFDPLSLALSPASDYYLVVYFANDTNNGTMGGAQPSLGIADSSLSSWYMGGDESHLTVGQSIPAGGRAQPIFLMYVMNN
ncbi:MAG: hypothetical protein ABSD64_06985 [Terriglobales bacterium]|jgi:hypothetical protein